MTLIIRNNLNNNYIKEEFKKKIKISDIMTYEEFIERYLVNKEEFQFYYKNKIVNICYGAKGTFGII